jgi:CubicO group peptidase (beta-lactamase class C family)
VREAFERSFAEGKELGAAVSVYRGTEPLVDLWGGYSDMAATRPWERDTMVLVLSATKGIAGLAPPAAVRGPN